MLECETSTGTREHALTYHLKYSVTQYKLGRLKYNVITNRLKKDKVIKENNQEIQPIRPCDKMELDMIL